MGNMLTDASSLQHVFISWDPHRTDMSYRYWLVSGQPKYDPCCVLQHYYNIKLINWHNSMSLKYTFTQMLVFCSIINPGWVTKFIYKYSNATLFRRHLSSASYVHADSRHNLTSVLLRYAPKILRQTFLFLNIAFV